MLRRYRTLLAYHGSPLAHDGRQVCERVRQHRRKQKLDRPAEVCGRCPAQEYCGIIREAVTAAFLREKSKHHQVVAKSARAAHCRPAPGRQGLRRVLACRDCGEDVQLNRSLESSGPLVCIDSVKKQFRRRHLSFNRFSHILFLSLIHQVHFTRARRHFTLPHASGENSSSLAMRRGIKSHKMKPPMNTEQLSRNQKLGDSLRLRVFVVKTGPNPPRRREATKTLSHF